MKSNGKLKQAAEEIKDILRKHNIAGAVQLHTPGHGEYFMHFNTDYSCAYIYNEEEVRFYSKAADYASKEDQLAKQRNTSNMLHILSNITRINMNNLTVMSEGFDKVVNAEHNDHPED